VKSFKEISPAEVFFRSAQLCRRALDRLLPGYLACFRDGRLNPKYRQLRIINEFLESGACAKIESRFFRSFADRQKTADTLKKEFPSSIPEIMDTAERIIRKEFPVFGRFVSYGKPVRWNYDPVSGKSAPRIFHADIDYLDFDRVGDHKIIWELNRHHHLIWLGKAYWITGDEKYTLEWLSQLEDWMSSNPPKIGINWASSLEIGIRSIAWIWSMLYFRKSRLVSRHFMSIFASFLMTNGIHIERNMSSYFSPNTHLTGEALALLYLGLLFRDTIIGNRWRRKAVLILAAEIERQTESDGTYFERSAYYHKYTADIYLHALILLGAAGYPVPDGIRSRLRKLLDFLMMTQKPDGRTPLFGDDDGGKILFLNNDPYDDFRGCLSTGAVLFGNPEYKERSGSYNEETLWLLGPDSLRIYKNLNPLEPAGGSVCFPRGGYYVMRSGWSDDSDYLLIDCGRHGWKNGGHAHSGPLAITAVLGGREVLTDPGTYTYTASPSWRDYFRGASAHNTVAVDDFLRAAAGGPFSWKLAADAVARRWISSDEFDYFSGRTVLYRNVQEPVTHRRDVLFLKKPRLLAIYDEIESGPPRRIFLNFHFPLTDVTISGSSYLIGSGEEYAGSLSVHSPHPMVRKLITDCVSPCFSIMRPSATGVCEAAVSGGIRIITLLSAENCAGWQIAESDDETVIMSLEERAPVQRLAFTRSDSGNLESSFACRIQYAREPDRILAVDGSRGFFPGIMDVRFRNAVDYLILEKSADSCLLTFNPDESFEMDVLGSRPVHIRGEQGNQRCAESAE